MKKTSVSSSENKQIITGTAFIVIPFNESWSDDVTEAIKDVCRRVNIIAKRADDLFDMQQTVMEDILTEIRQSEVIIADITKHNPNVFYELGIAEAMGKDIVLIYQRDGDKIPSDLANKRRLNYGMYPRSFARFKNDLEVILKRKKCDD